MTTQTLFTYKLRTASYHVPTPSKLQTAPRQCYNIFFMAHETLLTPEAYEKLKKELEELKGPVRARIAEAIREAKSHGDLKENAAYHEAKLR